MMKHANLKQLNNDGTETSIDLTDSNGNVIKKMIAKKSELQ